MPGTTSSQSSSERHHYMFGTPVGWPRARLSHNNGYAQHGNETPPWPVCEKPLAPPSNPFLTDPSQYDPAKVYVDLPIQNRDWSSKHCSFTYKIGENNGVLAKTQMKARDVMEFIYSRPADRPLTMYIQQVPAESKERHFPPQFPRCLLQDCPLNHRLHRYGLGRERMMAREPRIAFDEYDHLRTTLNLDPFRVSGYVHLYCAERFLDLQAMIRDAKVGWSDNKYCPTGLTNFTVKVDNRSYLQEPTGSYPAVLEPNERAIAQWYVKYAEEDLLKVLDGFYPSAADFAGPVGAHTGSLTQRLYESITTRTLPAVMHRVRMARLADPAFRDTYPHYAQGDLELVLADRVIAHAKSNPEAPEPTAQMTTLWEKAYAAFTVKVPQILSPKRPEDDVIDWDLLGFAPTDSNAFVVPPCTDDLFSDDNLTGLQSSPAIPDKTRQTPSNDDTKLVIRSKRKREDDGTAADSEEQRPAKRFCFSLKEALLKYSITDEQLAEWTRVHQQPSGIPAFDNAVFEPIEYPIIDNPFAVVDTKFSDDDDNNNVVVQDAKVVKKLTETPGRWRRYYMQRSRQRADSV